MEQIWPGLHGSTKIMTHFEHFDLYRITYGPVDYMTNNPKRGEGGDTIDIVWDLDPERRYDGMIFECYGRHKLIVPRTLSFVPCDTSSTKSLETALQWIKTCDEEHECIRRSGPKIPRRVLDVRNDRVRLRETTGEDHGARYACLSHCWGTDPTAMLRTTSSNLSSHQEDILWARLPRTFQDAVSFTRKLGVNLLWIDSLCIIQDDARDWQQQSADMANIYQNGYITLAATASRSADGGCYIRVDTPRLHRTGTPVALLRHSDGTKIPIFARRTFDHSLDSFPLLQRGWVRRYL